MLDEAVVLPNLLARRAAETPDRVYARQVGGEAWTYSRLDEQVRVWAARLAALDVEAGDRVVVMLPNSLDSIAVWLAVARLGAIEVPANTSYRGRFLTHLLNNSGATVSIVDPSLVERFAEVETEIPALERLVVHGAPAGTCRRLTELRSRATSRRSSTRRAPRARRRGCSSPGSRCT